MSTIKLGSREYKLPRSRIARIAIGIAVILCGFLGFLPILGFWMIPLGLVVLSVDIPPIHRFLQRPGVQAFFHRLERWAGQVGAWFARRWKTAK